MVPEAVTPGGHPRPGPNHLSSFFLCRNPFSSLVDEFVVLCSCLQLSYLLVLMKFFFLLAHHSTSVHLTALRDTPFSGKLFWIPHTLPVWKTEWGRCPVKSNQEPGRVRECFTSGVHLAVRCVGQVQVARASSVGFSPNVDLEVQVPLSGSKLCTLAPLTQRSVSEAKRLLHWAHLHTVSTGPQQRKLGPPQCCSGTDFVMSRRTQ